MHDLTIGLPVELEVKCQGQTLSLNSTVKVVNKDYILIDPITADGKTVGFTNNCMINMFVNENGNLYLWRNVKITLIRYNNKIFHKIHCPHSVKETHNRREAFRIYIGEDMPISINTAKGATKITVLVKDISESGMAFLSDQDLDIGKIVRLEIRRNNPIIRLPANIIRKNFNEELNNHTYGCVFLESNHDLGKYIAKKQLEYMKTRNYKF